MGEGYGGQGRSRKTSEEVVAVIQAGLASMVAMEMVKSGQFLTWLEVEQKGFA